MRTILNAKHDERGTLRCFLNGKTIGVAKAAELIKEYCTTDADYKLCVNVKMLESEKAKAQYQKLTVKELSKIEWYKGQVDYSEIVKPVYGENKVEFVPDKKANAEKEAKWEISSTIIDLKKAKNPKLVQAYCAKLAELANEYPYLYLKKLGDYRQKLTEYPELYEKKLEGEKLSADSKTADLLDKLEEIAANIRYAEDDGSNDDPEENEVPTTAEIDNEEIEDELIDPPITVDENSVMLTVADQFCALQLADDYYPNLHISGKLTKATGTLTAINNDGVTVKISDDYLEITCENVTRRINYDISESTFRAAVAEVTRKAITEGKIQDTFEIVGKSGLIYTYTEGSLKPVRSETPEEYNARISSAPKEISTLDTVPAKLDELWQILRQKQQALKAIMAENNIANTRKYSVKIAEIKLIIDAINNFAKTAA